MKRHVLILGLPYFGERLAAILRGGGCEARYYPHPGRDARAWLRLVPLLLRARVLYLLSSRVDRWSPQALIAFAWRRPLVVHWVGTDVLFALEAQRAGKASRRLLRKARHLADAPWLPGELAELGICAEYVPLPVPGLREAEPEPLPARFCVLLYYPVDPVDREVFDFETMMRLVVELPAVRFRLIPSPAETLGVPLPPNLETSGWVSDMEAVYRETTVYVRLTAHDGTSFMAVEALSRGRYVIWTHPLPGAIRASGYEEVSAALRALHARHERGELGLNEQGRAAVLRDFDRERLARELQSLVCGARPGRAEPAARIIS